MKELCFDISTWQKGINYQAIRERTNYCILRAGFGDFGRGIKDNRFEDHYANLQGMNLGAYWYTDARNEDQARSEARSFLEYVGDKKFTMPLYLDIEDPALTGLSRETLDNVVRAFGEVIEGAGYYFGVYTNLYWYRSVISGSELNQKYDWWIASWGDNDGEPHSEPTGVSYGVWQYTSEYNTFGERLDANFVYYDYPTIIREAGLNHLGGEPTPTPTPTPTPEPSGNFNIGDRVVVSGYATGDSYGGGNQTADYGGNPNDPDDIRFITAINMGAPRPYHISVGNTLGDGDRGWVAADQLQKI